MAEAQSLSLAPSPGSSRLAGTKGRTGTQHQIPELSPHFPILPEPRRLWSIWEPHLCSAPPQAHFLMATLTSALSCLTWQPQAPASKGCSFLHVFHNYLLRAYIVLVLLGVLAISQESFGCHGVDRPHTLATQSVGPWELDSNGHSGSLPPTPSHLLHWNLCINQICELEKHCLGPQLSPWLHIRVLWPGTHPEPLNQNH